MIAAAYIAAVLAIMLIVYGIVFVDWQHDTPTRHATFTDRMAALGRVHDLIRRNND